MSETPPEREHLRVGPETLPDEEPAVVADEVASALTPAELRARVLDLRVARGMTTAEIAAELGVSAPRVRRALDSALRAVAARIADSAELLRAEQYLRVETGLGAIWSAYIEGDLGAADRVVKLLARQAALGDLDLAGQRGTSGPAVHIEINASAPIPRPSDWSGDQAVEQALEEQAEQRLLEAGEA